MNTDAVQARVQKNMASGRLTQEQGTDVLEQLRLFNEHRADIEAQHPNKIVGFVAGHKLVKDGVHELFDVAERDYPGRLVYFEPIGFDLD